MTSINRFDRALDVLRQTLAKRASAGNTASIETHPQKNQEASQAAQGNRTAQVRRRIKDRLASLDLTQRADQERGATIFLETVLGNEFGADLLEDPAFYDLVAEVRRAMFADDATEKDLVTMLVELKDSD